MCDVNIATGQVERQNVDLFLPGQPPIEFTRIYDSTHTGSSFLGPGWRHSFDERLRWAGGHFLYDDGLGNSGSLVANPESGLLSNEALGVSLVEERAHWILQDSSGGRRHFPAFAGASSEAESRVVRVADKYGNYLEYDYLFASSSFTIRDQIGRSVLIERDNNGLLWMLRATCRGEDSVIDIRYEHDGRGRLTAVIDSIGRATSYEYDEHLLVRERRADGSETFWVYDDKGRCRETWRSGGVLYRRLEYDDRRKRVLVTNSLGHAYLYQLDENNLILSETDPLGGTSEAYYDGNGLMIASSNNAQSEGYNAVFDETFNCLRENFPYGTWTYEFNERGLMSKASDGNGGIWRFEYDPSGEVILQEHPGGVSFRAEYAPQGWVRRLTSQSGYSIVQERRDDRRRISLFDHIGTLCQMDLNAFGVLTCVSDASHPPVHLEHDTAGRLLRLQSGDDPPCVVEYDVHDNLARVTSETGNEWRFRFSPTGVLEEETDPTGAKTELLYDTEQQLVQMRNPNGEQTRIEYDDLGRPIQVQLPDGNVESYEYDSSSSIASVWINGAMQRAMRWQHERITEISYVDGARRHFEWKDGLPVSGTYRGHRLTRKLDERYRLLLEKGDGHELALSYDSSDNLVSVSTSDGRTSKFDYDLRRRVVQIDDSRCGLHRFSYGSGCEVSRWQIEGGCTVEFSHHPAGLLEGFKASDPSGRLVAEHRTTYRTDGKVLRETYRTTATTAEYHYRYDPAGRPTEILLGDSTLAAYRYDPNGNLVFSTELGQHQYAGGDRLLSAGPIRYEYDALHRVVSRTDEHRTMQFTYTSASELHEVRVDGKVIAMFEYDAFGRLASRSAGGEQTRFSWIEHTIFSEWGEAKVAIIFSCQRPCSALPSPIRRSGGHSYARTVPAHQYA